MMNEILCDKLEIFIITFNRANNLDKTLSQLLSENSPVKNFEIKIIDNNSTDNTDLIVQKYQAKFSNLKYEKNKYNIGGNANIVKAFLKAQKDYVWVLCDDDNYDWASWSEVEKSILNEDDAIVVNNIDCPELNKAQLYGETSFLPGVIYKTANITPEVIVNMQFNISNMFPHMAISSALFNQNKKFTIIQKPIVIRGVNVSEQQPYTRGYKCKNNLSNILNNLSYVAGYANTLSMINDSKLRNYLATKRRFVYPLLNSIEVFFQNKKDCNGSLYNLMSIFNCLDFFNKLRFLINYLLYLTVCKIAYIYKIEIFDPNNNKIILKYKIRLFNCINTNIIKFSYQYKGIK